MTSLEHRFSFWNDQWSAFIAEMSGRFNISRSLGVQDDEVQVEGSSEHSAWRERFAAYWTDRRLWYSECIDGHVSPQMFRELIRHDRRRWRQGLTNLNDFCEKIESDLRFADDVLESRVTLPTVIPSSVIQEFQNYLGQFSNNDPGGAGHCLMQLKSIVNELSASMQIEGAFILQLDQPSDPFSDHIKSQFRIQSTLIDTAIHYLLRLGPGIFKINLGSQAMELRSFISSTCARLQIQRYFRRSWHSGARLLYRDNSRFVKMYNTILYSETHATAYEDALQLCQHEMRRL